MDPQFWSDLCEPHCYLAFSARYVEVMHIFAYRGANYSIYAENIGPHSAEVSSPSNQVPGCVHPWLAVAM